MTKPIIVFFHLNGCGHCENFKQTWEEFNNKKNKQLLSLDIEASEDMNEKLNEIDEPIKQTIMDFKSSLIGYPTIIKVGKDKSIEEFSGNRTTSDLLKWSRINRNNTGTKRYRRRKNRKTLKIQNN